MRKILIILFAVLGIIAVTFAGIVLYKANSLPTCDSDFAIYEVIEIYRGNSIDIQKDIENIDSISMQNVKPISYDKDIKKYTCAATLTVSAKPGKTIRYSPAIKYNVKYEIYKLSGENVVDASWRLIPVWNRNR